MRFTISGLGYSSGDELDQGGGGVKHLSMFHCRRQRLGVCYCVRKALVKASLISEHSGHLDILMSHMRMQHSGTVIVYKGR